MAQKKSSIVAKQKANRKRGSGASASMASDFVHENDHGPFESGWTVLCEQGFVSDDLRAALDRQKKSMSEQATAMVQVMFDKARDAAGVNVRIGRTYWRMLAILLVKTEDAANIKTLLQHWPTGSKDAELVAVSLRRSFSSSEEWTETTLAVKEALIPFAPAEHREEDLSFCEFVREQNGL